MTPPASADVSCRVAWADDAEAIAEVQVRAWRSSYAGVLPDELIGALDRAEIADGWRPALVRPADARQRVLVALERADVVGFAITAPGVDPDLDPGSVAEISDLTVDPDRLRQGHASRLMQACVDTVAADGFDTAVLWLTTTDDALRGFLADGGWEPDGAHRELDLRGDGEVRLKQVRLHVAVSG